ncbi:helix-turn-helix domain-containing protein [Nocardia sp. NPDC003482]
MNTWFPRTPESDALVAEERLVLAATEMVHEALEATNTTKRQLADMLGVRPTEISQRLSGRRNLTLRSLARMMHVLGYGVGLEAIQPIDRTAADARVGTRIVKAIEPPTGSRNRSWKLGVRVLIGPIKAEEREFVEQRISRVLDELHNLDHILEATATIPKKREVVVGLTVEAEDALSASQTGIAALRTAIHIVGDKTPGWEETLERLVRDLRIDIDPSERDEQATTCS